MAYPLAHAGTHAFGAWTEGLKRVPGQRWWPTALNALAVMVLAASMAQWTWQLLQPPLPRIIAQTADNSASGNFDLQGLLAAQLFGQATPDSAPSATPMEQIPASDLNLVLVGVVAAGPESLALIRVEPEPETPFAIGDEISHGIRKGDPRKVKPAYLDFPLLGFFFVFLMRFFVGPGSWDN